MAYANAMVIRNPALFCVGGVDYSAQVSKVRFVPDTPTQTMRTFGGVDKDRDATSWTLEVEGHQDRHTGGLAAAIDTAVAAGGTVTVIAQMKAGAAQDRVSASIVPVPVEFGGETGSWKTFSQEFEVVDSPTFSQSS